MIACPQKHLKRKKREWRKVLARFYADKIAVAGAGVMVILLLTALFAPLLAPHDPSQQSLRLRLTPPSRDYPLGTDNLGRCVLSRIIYGARTSLSVGIITAVITMMIGVPVGLIAGYYGGMIDEIMMRFTDIVLSFPNIVLTLAIAGALGPSLTNLVISLTVVSWPKYARVIRGSVLSLKEREFVQSAKVIGAGDRYLMFRHILPNCLGPIIILMTLGVAGKIIAISGLSFLGLGAQPPIAEWGLMLRQGIDYMSRAPYLTIFPGATIMITVLALNLFGEGLRDSFDVHPGPIKQTL